MMKRVTESAKAMQNENGYQKIAENFSRLRSICLPVLMTLQNKALTLIVSGATLNVSSKVPVFTYYIVPKVPGFDTLYCSKSARL